jgi:hypothetical protein
MHNLVVASQTRFLVVSQPLEKAALLQLKPSVILY